MSIHEVKKVSLFLLCSIIVSLQAQVSVALFPLYNKTGDKLLDWIGYSFPELFFRNISELSGIQVWDPVFIFSADSSIWRLEVDTLMTIHQGRWKWDFAVGGSYTATDDSLWITVKTVRPTGNKTVSKRKKFRGAIASHQKLFRNILNDFLSSILKYTLSAEDARRLQQVQYHTEKKEVYATYATGYGYEMRGMINQAISAYSHTLDMDGSFAPALYRISMLYSQSRKRDAAQKYLEKAIEKQPNSSVIAAEMAEFLIYNDKPEKALSYVKSHREMLERTAAGMKTIGMGYMLTGEYQRAVSVLTRALAAGPADLETDFILGQAYLSLGQFSTAAEIFGRLIKYRPRHTRYYSFLGESYREAGRLMESCNVLEQAMKLDPDNVPNLINLANTCFKLGWHERAEQYLLRARELNPDMQEIVLNLGVLYWHIGKKAEAVTMFRQAEEDRISMQSALNNRANIFFQSGDIKKAIKAYKKADKYGKKSEIILYNLALAYRAAGKIKKSVACFDEVLMLSPNRMDVVIMQAQLASLLGDDEKAELYYRKILELSPDHKEAMTKLIGLYEKQERFEDAMKIVEGYLADFPQDLEYRLLLADLYRKMGWYEVSVAEYENMLKDKELKNNAKVYLGLGRSQFDIIRFKRRRNYEEVIYTLKKASELDPGNPEPDIIIGQIYMDFKKYRVLAMEHWQKAYNKAKSSHERQRVKDLMAGKKQ